MVNDAVPVPAGEVVRVADRIQAAAVGYVIRERQRQERKWGPQDHDLPWWALILGEEYGEACQAIYEAVTTRNPNRDLPNWAALGNGHNAVLDELSQVAAVAIAAMENLLAHQERSAADWR